MSKKDPYAGSSYRISKAEWDKLNEFFQKIEPPAQNELYASGDHYTLYLKLIGLGFRPASDAMEIYEMAEEILLLGWEE
jgi:hypothetical protein